MKASKTLHIFYSMLKSLPHIIVAQSLLDYSGYWGDHDLQKILLLFFKFLDCWKVLTQNEVLLQSPPSGPSSKSQWFTA